MTDNSSTSHQLNDNHSQDDEAGDPAEAFEALRGTVEELAEDLVREMTVIRKGVEAALDGQEKFQQPVDYCGHLAQIAENQALMVEHLKALAKSPILKNGPEHYARTIERGGESVVRSAVQQLQREASGLERAGRELTAHTKSAFERRDQLFWMWVMGGVGLIAGALLLVISPRLLPFSADSHVAALIMGRDRVGAGRAMIEAADPKKGQDIVTAGWVYETNRAAIDKCIKDMFKSQTEQRCVLTLPVVNGRSAVGQEGT